MRKNVIKLIVFMVTAALSWASLLSCVSDSEPGDDSYDYYDISEAVEDLARQLQISYENNSKSEGIEEPDKKRLAILESVDAEGNRTGFGKEITSALQSKMFNPELFALLERDQIESMVGEYTFNSSGMVEEVTASELGKLLGAEIVVLSSYTDKYDDEGEETRYRISARIVDLETGEILGIGRVTYVVEE